MNSRITGLSGAVGSVRNGRDAYLRKNRWQINVHANGDEAIEQMIRCYQSVLEETGSDRDLRPVVIHCQTVREDQLERMKRDRHDGQLFPGPCVLLGRLPL